MNRTPVRSSNLVSVGYDPDTLVLEIEFRGKRVYQYAEVPVKVWHSLMAAPSAGSFFDASIRNVYAAKAVTEITQE